MSREEHRRSFSRASNTAHGYFNALFDFSFTKFITVQMFPVLYGVILASTLIGVVYFTVEAFLTSWWRGLFYLFVAGPVGFITVATITRALMEFYLVVFHIYEDMEEIRIRSKRFSGLSESMESVAGITRRLPFLNGTNGSKSTKEHPDSGSQRTRRRRNNKAEPL